MAFRFAQKDIFPSLEEYNVAWKIIIAFLANVYNVCILMIIQTHLLTMFYTTQNHFHVYLKTHKYFCFTCLGGVPYVLEGGGWGPP